jgi:hypothetical protein
VLIPGALFVRLFFAKIGEVPKLAEKKVTRG